MLDSFTKAVLYTSKKVIIPQNVRYMVTLGITYVYQPSDIRRQPSAPFERKRMSAFPTDEVLIRKV